MSSAKGICCPECGDQFDLEDGLEEGDSTYCPACDAELEVLSLYPPKVKVASEGVDENKEEGEECDDEKGFTGEASD